MSATSVSRHAADVLLSVDPGDAQAMALAIALYDAKKSREQASASRDAAYRDRIDLMHRAADKLRDMAGKTLLSGIVEGLVGIANAGLSVCGSIEHFEARAELSAAQAEKIRLAAQKIKDSAAIARADQAIKAAKATNRQASWIEGGAKTLSTIGTANYFRSDNLRTEADKRDLEAQAERAGQRSAQAGDVAAEARRLEQSLQRQLEKLCETRGQAMRAAVGK